MALEFVGGSRALSSDGFSSVAQSLDVKAPEIWALVAVETSGCGFLADRRPKILFERHLFHKFTGGRFDDGDISDPSPGGYGDGGAPQYDRLARAIAKDRQAALRATSWGLGQILGDNCKLSGFADAESLVAAMCRSEDDQLTAVAAFLRSARLDSSLHAHDWASLARGYNGRDFAKNHYDTRLRGEFQKFSFGMMPDLDLRAAQLYLTYCGFHPGTVDGVLGVRTRSALVEFQKQQGLPATGKVTDTVLDALVRVALA